MSINTKYYILLRVHLQDIIKKLRFVSTLFSFKEYAKGSHRGYSFG